MMFPLMAAVAVLAANPNVTMEFDGTLKDGLKQLAQKSGLNLVVIGEFDERVNLNFPNVDGETALEPQLADGEVEHLGPDHPEVEDVGPGVGGALDRRPGHGRGRQS